MDQTTVSQDNRCTRCGGQMWFDPEAQTLVCKFCSEAPEPEATEADTVFHCPNCGAELTLITGSRQAKCEFCDGTFAMLNEGEDCKLTGDIPDNHKYVIPFTVDQQTYQKGMISWLANENLTPEDVFSKMAIIKTEGCYIPYYYCIASFKGTYTASVGYDRTETYVEHVRRKDAKGNMRTVPVTRTRTVTDWRPYNGTTSGVSNNLCEASRHIQGVHAKTRGANSEKMLKGIKESSQGLFESLDIQIDRKHPFDTKYTAGFSMLGCDDPVSKVYDKSKINADIRRQIEKTAPGDRIRDINFQGNIVPDYFLVYRPYWVTVYCYGDKICFNACEGTNAAKHYGTRPIDKEKKQRLRKLRNWLLISLGLLAVSFIGAMVVGSYSSIFLLFAVGTVLALISTVPAIIANIIGHMVLVRKGKQTNVESAKRHLENPSTIFGRKSAKADPTK